MNRRTDELDQSAAAGARSADAQHTLAIVVRLIGLMLLAKFAVEVIDAFSTDWAPAYERLLAALVIAAPTAALWVASMVLQRRNPVSAQAVKTFLVVVMVVNALQIVARPLALYAFSPTGQGDLLGAFSNRSFGGFARSRAHLQTGMVFLMIPAVLGAWVSSRRGAARWAILGITLGAVAVAALGNREMRIPDMLPFIAEDAALVMLTLFVGLLADQGRAEQLRLKEANLRLAEQSRVREELSASRERMRMARDLHDTVAHSLAGLVFQLDALGMVMGDAPEQARATLLRAKGIAKNGLADARAAITNLRAGLVGDLGLSDALRQYAESATQLGPVPVTFSQVSLPATVQPDPALFKERLEMLSKDQADGLFRIAQEAIRNATRHARAKQVNVSLLCEEIDARPAAQAAYVSLRVQDNGIGFDETIVGSGHYGLDGMRERAELIGGQLRIDSQRGVGTTISVTLAV